MSTIATSPAAHNEPRTTVKKALWLLLFIALVGAAAAIGVLASSNSSEIYASLDLPAFAPPAWLFGPAWTVLYLLIALAAWLSFLRTGWDRALTLWAVQLVFVAAWTPLFFAAGKYWVAMADITVLWVLVLAVTVMFFRRSRIAGLLMAPYLAWVTYAGALNLAIALAN